MVKELMSILWNGFQAASFFYLLEASISRFQQLLLDLQLLLQELSMQLDMSQEDQRED